MAFVTILQPQSESELVIALAILEAQEIENFVHGQYLGSLLPGLQIESYNTRSIMVPEELADDARDALAGLSPADESVVEPVAMRLRDRVRVVLEAALFGWFVPGKRRSK